MLSDNDVLKILDAAMSTTADFAEVFQEEKSTKTVSLLNGRVIRAGTGYNSGTGIRLLAGTNCVYVHSNDNDIESLLKLAQEASHAIKGISRGEIADISPLIHTSVTNIDIDPMKVAKSDTVGYLRNASEHALAYNGLITQVAAGYAATERLVRITNTRGVNKEDST
ncbi:MAG: hypothetical protein II641_07460, partial [Clostridiales bacterium]|nr:hypothetical protein [Clostridiales bacterium]